MRSLRNTGSTGSRLAVATAATALPFPPVVFGFVPSSWSGNEIDPAVFPEFELELHGSTAIAMTNAVMYGGTLISFTFAASVMTSASAVSNAITKAGHGFKTGDGPVRATTAAGLPGGVELLTDYWIVRVDANSYKLATSFENALAGATIDLTSAGTDMTISPTATTTRLYWSTHDDLLGLAGDGAIALDGDRMYRKRIPHSPRVVAYALVADIDTGNVTAAIVPIVDR